MSEVALPAASPLAESFQRCSRSFKELYLGLFSYGPISLSKFNDEYGRFGVWGGDSGADRTGRGSLDDVLRNDGKTTSIIAEVLENLDDDLKTCIALVKEAPGPQDTSQDQAPDGQEWLSDEDSSVSSGSDSGDSENGSRVSVSKTQRILHLLAIIVDHIQSLFQISTLLRRPTISDKYLRSLSKRANQESESSFFRWDLAHVAEKKWRWAVDMDQQGNASYDVTNYLTKRLAAANVRRREQLDFWQSHPAQPGTLNLPTKPLLSDKPVAHVPTRPDRLESAKEAAPRSEMSKPTQGTKHSFSTVAKSDLNDAATFSGRPRTEYVSSRKGGKYVLRVPDVPKVLTGSPTLKCPYCLTILDAKSMTQREIWKKHVFRDLRPYVCTFERCENPEKLYLTRHDWVYHETQMHRRQWMCASCSHQTFNSRNSLENHLRAKHSGSFHESQLSIMVDICERPMEDEKDADCPLCPVTIPLSALRVHLATHLEDLALFILPISMEERSQDAGSDKAEGAPDKAVARDASDSEDGLPALDFEKGSSDSSHVQVAETFSALLQSKTVPETMSFPTWISRIQDTGLDDSSVKRRNVILHNISVDELSIISMVTMQLEYYFSRENLIPDIFLRKHMDSQGFVKLDFIAKFKRIQSLTRDYGLVVFACRESKVIYITKGEDGIERIRRRDGWEPWILPMEDRDPVAQNDGPLEHYPLSPGEVKFRPQTEPRTLGEPGVSTTSQSKRLSSHIRELSEHQDQIRDAFPIGDDNGSDYAYNKVRNAAIALIDHLTRITPDYLQPYDEYQIAESLNFLDEATSFIHNLPQWTNVWFRVHKDNAYDEISTAWSIVIPKASALLRPFHKSEWNMWRDKIISHNHISGSKMKAAIDTLNEFDDPERPGPTKARAEETSFGPNVDHGIGLGTQVRPQFLNVRSEKVENVHTPGEVDFNREKMGERAGTIEADQDADQISTPLAKDVDKILKEALRLNANLDDIIVNVINRPEAKNAITVGNILQSLEILKISSIVEARWSERQTYCLYRTQYHLEGCISSMRAIRSILQENIRLPSSASREDSSIWKAGLDLQLLATLVEQRTHELLFHATSIRDDYLEELQLAAPNEPISRSSGSVVAPGYGGAYEQRSQFFPPAHASHINTPMEPIMSSEEVKAIDGTDGYLYYPAPLFEGSAPLARYNDNSTYTLPNLANEMSSTSSKRQVELIPPAQTHDNANSKHNTLFIGNLSFQAEAETLREAFGIHGIINRIWIPRDVESGSSKGFGYVTFASIEDAEYAYRKMNGAEICGQPIRLDYAAKPRT